MLTAEVRAKTQAAASTPEANAKKAAWQKGRPIHPNTRAALEGDGEGACPWTNRSSLTLNLTARSQTRPWPCPSRGSRACPAGRIIPRLRGVTGHGQCLWSSSVPNVSYMNPLKLSHHLN